MFAVIRKNIKLLITALPIVFYLIHVLKYEKHDGYEQVTKTLNQNTKKNLDLKLFETLAKPAQIITNATEILQKSPQDIKEGEEYLTLPRIPGIKNHCVLQKGDDFVPNASIEAAMENKGDMYCFPYFYIAGFVKCGTSDLRARINCVHPIQLKPRGEINFWDNKMNLHFPLSWYGRTFRDFYLEAADRVGNELAITGDKSPVYMSYGDHWRIRAPNAKGLEPVNLLPQRLAKILPNSKFIVMLRDPVSRLFSDYKFFHKEHSAENCANEFHEKLTNAFEWWNNCLAAGLSLRACAYGCEYEPTLPNLDCINCLYPGQGRCIFSRSWANQTADRLRVGIYAIFVREWLKYLPRENFLFIKFETYAKNSTDVILNTILPFLGVTNEDRYNFEARLLKNSIRNLGPQQCNQEILPETKQLLRDFYAPYNKQLQDLLGDEFTWD